MRLLESRAGERARTLVLLMSDGQDFSFRGDISKRLLDSGALVSTLGIGFDHDASLLDSISKQGGGTFSYAPNASLIASATGAAVATAHMLVGINGVVTVGDKTYHVGSITSDGVAYLPIECAPGDVAKLSYSALDDATPRFVDCSLAVAEGEADVPAVAAVLELYEAHALRVAVASVLKDSSALQRGGRRTEATLAVAECRERVANSLAAVTQDETARALMTQLLTDLDNEMTNLTRVEYDRGQSLQAAASHQLQTASGTGGGQLYATQSRWRPCAALWPWSERAHALAQPAAEAQSRHGILWLHTQIEPCRRQRADRVQLLWPAWCLPLHHLRRLGLPWQQRGSVCAGAVRHPLRYHGRVNYKKSELHPRPAWCSRLHLLYRAGRLPSSALAGLSGLHTQRIPDPFIVPDAVPTRASRAYRHSPVITCSSVSATPV